MVLGTIIGQLLVIISSPVLTRLYTPEDFGIFAIYVSIYSFITIVSSLRYELAIPLPKLDATAWSIIVLSLTLVAITVASTGGGVFIFGNDFVAILNTPAFEPYLWLLPIGILIGGSHKIFNFWMLRKKTFRVIAVARVFQGGGMSLFQIVLGFFQLSSLGLIIGHIMGFFMGLILFIKAAVKSNDMKIRQVKLSNVKSVSKRYSDFPKYSTWSDMLNVFGTQFPMLLIASLYTPVAAGLYLLANRVANAPVALVAESVGKVFMAEAVSVRGGRKLPVLSLNVFRALLRIGLGPLIMIAIVAPELFGIIFGEKWIEAGLYLQLMTPWVASVFIFVPLMSLYVVLELQRVELKFQILIFITRIVGLLIGASMGGAIYAIFVYSICAAVAYTMCGLWVLNNAGVKYKSLIGSFTYELIFIFFLGAILLFIKDVLLLDQLIIFLVAIALGVTSIYRAKSILIKITNSEI